MSGNMKAVCLFPCHMLWLRCLAPSNIYYPCLFAELYTKRMFQLLLSAYSTISTQDTALFLGMNEDDAAYCKILSLMALALVLLLSLFCNRLIASIAVLLSLNLFAISVTY